MKKLSLSKKLLLAGGILALAVACQSKPIRQPSQNAQPLKSEIQEQGEEENDEESSWDHTESFKTEEKQLKSAVAPAPEEPAKAAELPKPTVAVPAQAAPVVETKTAPAPQPSVVDTPAPVAAPTAPVVEVQTPAAPVVEEKTSSAAAAPVAEAPAIAIPSEKEAVTENVIPSSTTP